MFHLACFNPSVCVCVVRGAPPDLRTHMVAPLNSLIKDWSGVKKEGKHTRHAARTKLDYSGAVVEKY